MSFKQTEDENGVFTVEILMKIASGTSYSGFTGTLNATNAIIQEVSGSDLFLKSDSSNISENGLSARLVTTYNTSTGNGLEYIGTGEDVKVGEFKYIHDPNATSDDCRVSVIPDGGTEKSTSPNKPSNPKTGSALPYVGIIAGLGLIAGAYVISKKSTKLYRM